MLTYAQYGWLLYNCIALHSIGTQGDGGKFYQWRLMPESTTTSELTSWVMPKNYDGSSTSVGDGKINWRGRPNCNNRGGGTGINCRGAHSGSPNASPNGGGGCNQNLSPWKINKPKTTYWLPRMCSIRGHWWVARVALSPYLGGGGEREREGSSVMFLSADVYSILMVLCCIQRKAVVWTFALVR